MKNVLIVKVQIYILYDDIFLYLREIAISLLAHNLIIKSSEILYHLSLLHFPA